MASTDIIIHLPGGREQAVSRDKFPIDASLARALELVKVPLNMRCEGRGLCRGCQVEIESDSGSRSLRACQHRAADVLPGLLAITIPENSWRDHSLHGVSQFEIHTSVSGTRSRTSGYGIALDIGTTTLAAALWDFSTGVCLGSATCANPQSRYGDNVVTRIQYAVGNEIGVKELQQCLVEKGLVPLIAKLCRAANVEPEQITHGTASGNPTMLHALAGESLQGLSKFPFKPVFLGAREVDTMAIGFSHAFELTLLPGLGPFVGSDISVGALASGIMEGKGPVLLIDFGTNGEILLRHNGGYLATATAAGPAFEGGRLSCGAAARDGIISSLQMEDGKWKWKLTGDQDGEPAGISGAAYVDFLAHGRYCGLLDRFGRMDRQHADVYQRVQGDERDTAINLGQRVYITEADVAELLQAKAAIAGGVATLLELAELEATDLSKVIVAGGFGYHLDPDCAIRIGLLPDVPRDRVQIVGNASLGGACLLLNDPANERLASLLSGCEVIELNQVDSFEDHFTDGLSLDPMEE